MVNFNQQMEAEGYVTKLPSSTQMPEGQVHKLIMNQPGISGLHSVHKEKLILFHAL